jgi:ABC-type multidrug transport system fused ATPase/permease subunit
LGAANPFIINKLTANIETKVTGFDMELSAKDGLYLTGLFMITALVHSVVGEQLAHFNFMVGRKNS